MARITDYMVAGHGFANELGTLVANAILQGWQPYGFMFFQDEVFFQTLVKYEGDFLEVSTGMSDGDMKTLEESK